MGNKTPKYNAILFDLDGTIIDPKKGIINSILYAIRKLHIVEKNHHELDSFIGPPLRDSFQQRYNLDIDRGNAAVNYYREYYSKQGVHENTLYAEITNVIKLLHANNVKIYLATSKPTFFAEQIIDFHNLTSYFLGIVGSNLDNTRTDKTEIIEYIFQNHQLKKDKTLMIGDRKFDINGAKNHGIHSVGVTYGYAPHNELQEAQPNFIIDCPKELIKIVL